MNCGFPLDVATKNEISPPIQRQQKSAEGAQKMIVTPTKKGVGFIDIVSIYTIPNLAYNWEI